MYRTYNERFQPAGALIMETVAIEIERDAAGRFVAGRSGNPAGKRPGTRNRATVIAEALRDGEDATVARVVIEKALSGHVATARFILGLISPKPRGRTIHLPMPTDDDCNVVAAYNSALRLLCAGEITPDEAVTISRFLDGRRRVLQAWQLEDRLISYQRELAEDRAADYDDAAADADAGDESDWDVADEAAATPADRPAPEPAASASPSPLPEPAPSAAAAPPEASPASLPAAGDLQKPCISPSPGTIRGTIQIPVGKFGSSLEAILARRLAVRSAER